SLHFVARRTQAHEVRGATLGRPRRAPEDPIRSKPAIDAPADRQRDCVARTRAARERRVPGPMPAADVRAVRPARRSTVPRDGWRGLGPGNRSLDRHGQRWSYLPRERAEGGQRLHDSHTRRLTARPRRREAFTANTTPVRRPRVRALARPAAGLIRGTSRPSPSAGSRARQDDVRDSPGVRARLPCDRTSPPRRLDARRVTTRLVA